MRYSHMGGQISCNTNRDKHKHQTLQVSMSRYERSIFQHTWPVEIGRDVI